ncbi:MAG TPA: hypothetical protein VK111_12525 [Virgibacillus sp.]|nr:hypothetical protein [Virgibacillus sp.]
MQTKWMTKLGTIFFALALVSACSTTNDNEPADNNVPENENYDDTRNNENVPDVHEEDMEKNNDQDPNMNNDSGRRN